MTGSGRDGWWGPLPRPDDRPSACILNRYRSQPLMSVTLHWDDESCTILRVDYAGRWTVAEVRAALDEMNQILAGFAATPAILLNHIGAYVPPHFGYDVVQLDDFLHLASGFPELVVFVGN